MMNNTSDVTVMKKYLFIAACNAIWNYRMSTLPNNYDFIYGGFDTIRTPKCCKHTTTSAQLMDVIKSLLRMPIDLLSMKMHLYEEKKERLDIPNSVLSHNHMDTELSIMHWACFVGADEVIRLILDIDPDQINDECSPLCVLMGNESGDNLPLIRHICDLYPDALTIVEDRMTRMCGNLPIHYAIYFRRSIETVHYLVQKHPQSLAVRNGWNLLPINFFYLEDINNDGNNEHMRLSHQFLMANHPQSLGNRFLLESHNFSGFHMHQWFIQESPNFAYMAFMVKHSFEWGKALNVFGKDTAYGLFEEVKFDFDILTSHYQDMGERRRRESMWMHFFGSVGAYKLSLYDIKRTTLELFLYMSLDYLDETSYTYGWACVLETFKAARDTAILQPAIGRVQDDLLPYIIEKFSIDLMQPDEHGRTPLTVSMYHLVFVANDSSDNSDDAVDGDPSLKHEDKKRKVSSNGGYEGLLSDASIILSSGKKSYRRRDIFEEESTILRSQIALMLGNNQTRRMDLDSNDAGNINADNNTTPAKVRDANGRLPLHIGCEIGLRWSCGLEDILDAYSFAVEVVDSISGFYAFMLAAVGADSDLSTVFKLLVKQPDVLEKLY